MDKTMSKDGLEVHLGVVQLTNTKQSKQIHFQFVTLCVQRCGKVGCCVEMFTVSELYKIEQINVPYGNNSSVGKCLV